MKRYLLLIILTFSLLCFCCVSTSKSIDVVQESVIQIPKWITDQGRLEIFPDSIYISQLAYGNTAQESKEKASANISEYIKSTVVSSSTSSYLYKSISNNVMEHQEVREDISISTDNNLYKIEYTNPFYYSDLGQFACVAYINKEQAFNFVKPKLETAKQNFSAAFTNALSKESLLDKIIGIKNAQKLLVDFYEVYDFARAINPTKATVYEEVDFIAKQSFAKVNELARDVLIKVMGQGDSDLLNNSGVIAELSNQFSKLGFVVGNSTKYNCLALVEVKSVINQTSKTFETYPELFIRIIEKGEEKISYTKKLSKVAGFDKETVVRRTNLKLIEDIRTSFINVCF